jgi:AcrR family transcriptional regulator
VKPPAALDDEVRVVQEVLSVDAAEVAFAGARPFISTVIDLLGSTVARRRTRSKAFAILDVVSRDSAPVGGRGARDRILRAADRLFYQQGIHATGVAALAEEAHVSTRTLYQHFATKNALVEAYLRRHDGEAPIPSEAELERDDLPAAERLLAVFKPLEAHGGVLRGCPFHNAAVEAAGALPGVAGVVEEHKKAFLSRIIATAREAKAADPQSLGRQLAVLYEGANALAASRNDNTAFADARHAAQALIDAALGVLTTDVGDGVAG